MPIASKRKTQRPSTEQLWVSFSGLDFSPHRDGTSAMTLRGRSTRAQENQQMRSVVR